MLVGNSQSFPVHPVLLVHRDSFFRLLRVDKALLSFGEVTPFNVELCLVQEDLADRLRVVLTGDLKSRVPVLLVLVHVDGLLRLVGFDELFFSFFEAVLVFQVEGVLQVHFGHLVLRVVVGQRECLGKPLLIGFEINSGFNESVLDQELGALLSAHVLRHFDRDFAEFLLTAVGFRDS